MISLKITGQKDLLRSLGKISDPKQRHKVMDDIGAYNVASTQQRFIDQKSPDGQDWEQSYRAKETGGQTLRNTNRLFQSLTHDASPDHAEWGTNVIYAAIQQFGGTIKAKSGKFLRFATGTGFAQVKQVTLPAREFMGINETDRSEIKFIVDDWVSGAFK